MSSRRQTELDALERRLAGPKRVALFGHRNVGKTTLLAMLYREASAGRVPGLRLAAADATSAEYLASTIARVEAGESPPGTLAETELRLRLYGERARFDLIVKDYQGEHVALGSDEPIRRFFADCDAVFLCLDPEGSADPAERRRRQQEVEELLERYIEGSADATTGRPVALLLTKYDRVEEAGADAPAVERVVEAHFGMSRHALDRHAPGAAIFGVSSFGPGASDGRPPAEMRPEGLEGPLAWLAGQLEAADRAALEALWERAPADLGRLSRCVAAVARRYPGSDFAAEAVRRLEGPSRLARRRRRLRAVAAAAATALGLLGYDAWGYRAAQRFGRDNPAPAVARRWSALLAWHPTLPLFAPSWARRARLEQAEWAVRAAELQVAHGTAPADLGARLVEMKDRAPHLDGAIRRVERAREQARHDELWRTARAEALAPSDEPGPPLEALRAFLREFPDTPHRAEALALVAGLKARAAERASAAERVVLDDLARSEALPHADLRDLADRAQRFLAEHPESRWRAEAEARLEGYLRTLDARDVERARLYSKQYPTHFATRLERYQDYLRAHQSGGRYVSEAIEAKDRILREWDAYAYRQAYDHQAAHPDDVAEVAHRLRDYLRDHADGRFARDARAYLEWWDRVSVPGEYRVTLRRGEFDPTVSKYLAGGGPDLGVVVEVAGATYGPSPVVRNTSRPIWDYTFPRPIKWKLGDPVTVRVIDYDWSDSVVAVLNSRRGDPLAIRNLSGTIRSGNGGKTTLVFASTFTRPALPRPD